MTRFKVGDLVIHRNRPDQAGTVIEETTDAPGRVRVQWRSMWAGTLPATLEREDQLLLVARPSMSSRSRRQGPGESRAS
jgi:hypothetical protein